MLATMSTSLPLDAFPDSYQELIGFVARRTGNRQTAQDLVHDAWLRIAEHENRRRAAAEPEPEPARALAPRAYLYTVAERLAIDHLRHSRRTAERFDTDAGGSEGVSLDVADAHSHREALRAVDAALADLPERSRAIFLADRLDGMPHAAIAAAHGVSVKTVEREVQRAMDAIERALRQWRGEEAVIAGGRRTGRRRALSSLLGVAALGAGSGALWQAWRHWVPGWQVDVTTTTGRQVRQGLPDGSTLHLDALGRAQVRYYAGRRHVRLLAGTAFFDVARDAGRPFVVDAGPARITVLGTRFEVALSDEGGLSVGVEHGRVRVALADGQVFELREGEALQWAAGGLPARQPVHGGVATWREGWLDFHHTPLGEVARRLQRYSPRLLRVSPDAAALTVLGRVHIAEAGGWLRLLPRTLPVRVEEAGEGAQREIVIAAR